MDFIGTLFDAIVNLVDAFDFISGYDWFWLASVRGFLAKLFNFE